MDGAAGIADSKAADEAQDAPPPPEQNANTSSSKPKVSLSLGKKKRKKTGTSSSNTNANTNEHFAASTSALAQESQDANRTVADRAEEVTKSRRGELVIPCVGGGASGGGRTRPLLAGRARALPAEKEVGDGGGFDDNGVTSRVPVKSEDVTVRPDPDVDVDIDGDADANDAAAAEALIRSATDRSQNRAAGGAVGDTNFDAARGHLVIKKEDNTNELMAQAQRRGKSKPGDAQHHHRQDDEAQEFKRDLARQADDLDVESEAYATVPISEFGAAMLRGMGWTGGDANDANGGNRKNGNGNDDGGAGRMKPRHHRLGLGAAPRPVSLSNKDGTNATATKPGGRHRALRPHEVERAEQERRDEEEFRRRAAERARLDKQRTVQVGSIVRVRENGTKRAIMVKTSGVPGLNQVLIRWEGTTEDVSVRKSDVVLLEQAEIDDNPFKEAAASTSSGAERKANRRDGSEEEKKESSSGVDQSGRRRRDDDDRRRSSRSAEKCSDRDRKRDRYDDRNRRDRYRDDEDRRDRKKSRSSRDDDRRHSSRDDDRDRDSSHRRGRDHNDDDYASSRDRKRSRKERSDGDDKDKRSSDDHRSKSGRSNTNAAAESLRWLAPNIRVRVISKKLAKGRQYKEKGVVLDVLPGGAHATIQMTDGEVLDKVTERYLETALPKVGGNAIVLAGDAQHRYAKGRLLERDSSKGRAAVQLFEEMNILNVSLDDIAEWCGPLDSDMMG